LDRSGAAVTFTALEALQAGQEKPTYVYMCTGFQWHCMCPKHVKLATPAFRKRNKFKRLDDMAGRPSGSMIKRVYKGAFDGEETSSRRAPSA
jgi:hypothetical protein